MSDREICEAATAGPWRHHDEVYSRNSNRSVIGDHCTVAESISRDNAAFIAHFNPTKVMAMLDELADDAVKLEVKRLEIKQRDDEIARLECCFNGVNRRLICGWNYEIYLCQHRKVMGSLLMSCAPLFIVNLT